jgi:hypothetical protein
MARIEKFYNKWDAIYAEEEVREEAERMEKLKALAASRE